MEGVCDIFEMLVTDFAVFVDNIPFIRHTLKNPNFMDLRLSQNPVL